MAPPIGPLVDEGTGDRRAAMAQGLIDLAAFLATHGVPLPGGDKLTLSVRVKPGAARGERIEALQEIADRMGVPVTSPPDPVTGKPYGLLEARREFGPVALVATVAPEGCRHLVERQDALAGKAGADARLAYHVALDEADGQLADEADALAVIAAAEAEAAA